MSLVELNDYVTGWLEGATHNGFAQVDPEASAAGARGFRDGEQAYLKAKSAEQGRLAGDATIDVLPPVGGGVPHESGTLGAVRRGTLAALGIQTEPSATPLGAGGSGVAGPFPRENEKHTPIEELRSGPWTGDHPPPAPAVEQGVATSFDPSDFKHGTAVQLLDGDEWISAPPRKRWIGAGGYNPAAVACKWVNDVTEGRNPITLNVSAEEYDHARALLRRVLEEVPLLAPGEASRETAHDVHTLRAIVVSTLAALGAQPETAASELPRVAATVQHFATAKSRVAWGVAHNAGMRSHERRVRWAHVADVTGLGSTSARQLCRDQGVDPDEEIGGDS